MLVEEEDNMKKALQSLDILLPSPPQNLLLA
jgi:hypothetical protein